MNNRIWLIITTISLFWFISCNTSSSIDDTYVYTKEDFLGTWFYGDTCLLWQGITYTFSESTCIENIVYIGSLDLNRILQDTTIYRNWYIQNDSLFLLFDTADINHPKNKIFEFHFKNNDRFLLLLNNTSIWIEFNKTNQLLE